ncbi:MAG: SpoVA/SpoVAEb family sporulation membrane protein [Bacillota bacterium]|nr:SpoVA/SpoVAEb family sporulation membrane protein [Bacillota bacterium]
MEATKVDRLRFEAVRRRHAPRRPVLANAARAFLVGGLICLVGEAVRQGFMAWLRLSPETSATPATAAMIALGAVLTGLGLWDRVARFGGMGASLPVTGFANAMVAPAMEYKRDGWVFGVGGRLFQLAGPVLLYGLLTAVAAGTAYYILYAPR